MQEIETLALPTSGKQVTIRGYVTGFIDQEVRKISLSANKARYEVDASSLEGQNPGEMPRTGKMVMETDPTAQINADNKLLELMVLSVDGNNSDVLNQLLALPTQDVKFVMSRVKALQAASEVSDSEKKG